MHSFRNLYANVCLCAYTKTSTHGVMRLAPAVYFHSSAQMHACTQSRHHPDHSRDSELVLTVVKHFCSLKPLCSPCHFITTLCSISTRQRAVVAGFEIIFLQLQEQRQMLPCKKTKKKKVHVYRPNNMYMCKSSSIIYSFF